MQQEMVFKKSETGDEAQLKTVQRQPKSTLRWTWPVSGKQSIYEFFYQYLVKIALNTSTQKL